MKKLINEDMGRHTSFRAGGPAAVYIIPESREELVSLVGSLRREGSRYSVLGNGTNLLVSDRGIAETVIEIGKGIDFIGLLDGEDSCILAEAGASLSAVASFAARMGLSGMEALHGIPGTVGGAVVMNAGAYGTEMKDVLLCCEVLTKEGEEMQLPAGELDLSYRHSAVPENGWIVLSATFRLSPAEPSEIQQRMREFRDKRAEKQPLDKASAGSTFRRPSGNFAGRLIEEAGLKGCRFGGAQVSEKHCGFIINEGNASAGDIYGLICHVRDLVEEKSGIRLEPEVKFWGDFS